MQLYQSYRAGEEKGWTQQGQSCWNNLKQEDGHKVQMKRTLPLLKTIALHKLENLLSFGNHQHLLERPVSAYSVTHRLLSFDVGKNGKRYIIRFKSL